VRAWVAVTDEDWYRFLSQRPHLEEVNFWQPGGSRVFGALSPGEPFLFKLHHPDNAIVGGGFFTHASPPLPVSVAWEAFGEKNGAGSFEEMRRRIERYRRAPEDPRAQYLIGSIILQEPFFLAEADWVPAPADFKPQIVQGKTYDLDQPVGRALWLAVLERWRGVRRTGVAEPVRSEIELDWRVRPVRQRLGQGAFRVLVTDVYQRRCAITGEKALPVLQAAHIRPVTREGLHRVDNGLLLRSDIHTLFDQGYVTVTPDHRVRVSRRLKADFHDGEPYYPLAGKTIWLPGHSEDHPGREHLEWHADTVFLG
jgi:HNH endonuclease